MKRVSKSIAVAVAVLLLVGFASRSWAAQITISNPGSNYRSGSGGEFRITGADAAGVALVAGSLPFYNIASPDGTAWDSGFETFCVEFNEYISLPGTYSASISGGAIYGGVAGGVDPDGAGPLPTSDPVSVGTAYLYRQFATGVLAGYTYANGAGRAASAVLLQQAIWYLEDEIVLTDAQKAANPFLNGAAGAITLFGDGTGVGVGGAKANNTIYSVGVLNLGGVAPNQKQDQLIMVPDGGLTLTLLGLGLGGLALLRRKLS